MIPYKNWKPKSPINVKLLDQVKKTVFSIFPNAEIVLYGSRARGGCDIFSDWDFLILTEQPLEQSFVSKLKDRLYDLELDTDSVLSSIIRTKNEWNSDRYKILPFRQNLEKEGIVL